LLLPVLLELPWEGWVVNLEQLVRLNSVPLLSLRQFLELKSRAMILMMSLWVWSCPQGKGKLQHGKLQ
jgi:hypothetical protein